MRAWNNSSIGSKGDLNPHLNSCVFESLKPFILKTTQRIAELQATVEVPQLRKSKDRFKTLIKIPIGPRERNISFQAHGQLAVESGEEDSRQR